MMYLKKISLHMIMRYCFERRIEMLFKVVPTIDSQFILVGFSGKCFDTLWPRLIIFYQKNA